MDAPLLLRGLILGFSIAAPVGPIGVLCIRRSVADGRAAGLVSGLGAATADAMYGCVAAFGLTFVSTLLVGQQAWLRLLGGLFLLYLGARTFLAAPAERAASVKGTGLKEAYLSTLLLTLTNPMTILSFAAVFAGLGIAEQGRSYTSAASLVAGVFLGSSLWWLILSGVAGRVRGRLGPTALMWVNRASGTIVAGFGVVALLSLQLL